MLDLHLDLYMTVIVHPNDAWEVNYIGIDFTDLAVGEDNLIVKTIINVAKKYRKTASPLKLEVESAIPLGKGFGSSASAIAAGIVIADHLLALNLSDKEKVLLGSQLEGHADNISAALLGGAVISYFDGETIDYIHVEKPEICAVVLIPPKALATEDSRGLLPEELKHKRWQRARRPVRRAPLRHGDADAQRGIPRTGANAPARRRGRVLAPTLIGRTKAAHPDFLFIAEAYWDMEWTLQQQGFDLCYDKRLYDRLVQDPPSAVRGHLQADPAYQEDLLTLHREPRRGARRGDLRGAGAGRRGGDLDRWQGARLYHDGQLDGRRTRIPVFLGRGPDETADRDLRAFYEQKLVRAVADSHLRDAQWQLCDCKGWPDTFASSGSCRGAS